MDTVSIPYKSVFGTTAHSEIVWDNLVNDKRLSSNWARGVYKRSIIYSFWSLFTGPVD